MVRNSSVIEGLKVLDIIDYALIAQYVVNATTVISGSMVEGVELFVIHKFKVFIFAKLFKSKSVLISSEIAAETYNLCVKVTSYDGSAIH